MDGAGIDLNPLQRAAWDQLWQRIYQRTLERLAEAATHSPDLIILAKDVTDDLDGPNHH